MANNTQLASNLSSFNHRWQKQNVLTLHFPFQTCVHVCGGSGKKEQKEHAWIYFLPAGDSETTNYRETAEQQKHQKQRKTFTTDSCNHHHNNLEVIIVITIIIINILTITITKYQYHCHYHDHHHNSEVSPQ